MYGQYCEHSLIADNFTPLNPLKCDVTYLFPSKMSSGIDGFPDIEDEKERVHTLHFFTVNWATDAVWATLALDIRSCQLIKSDTLLPLSLSLSCLAEEHFSHEYPNSFLPSLRLIALSALPAKSTLHWGISKWRIMEDEGLVQLSWGSFHHGCLLKNGLWWPEIWGSSLTLPTKQALLLPSFLPHST